MRKALSENSIIVLLLYITLFACKKETPQSYSSSVTTGGNSGSRVTYPPIAYAGVDTTIYAPFTGYYLNSAGTNDPDNNIASFSWRFVAGPSLVAISKSSTAATNVTGLFIQGVYSFELTVKDNDNLSARDTVLVTVGNSNCTSQLAEIVLPNLRWEFSWIMDLNIEIAKVLPAHSRVKSIFIRRDNGSTWEPVVILDPTSPDYKFHTWAYGTNTLQIYPPDSNMVNDTPDVKIQYCK